MIGAAALYGHFDREELDDRAGRILTAVAAVIEFGRPRDEDAQHEALYQAAATKGLLVSLAALIVHPHQDEEQHAEILALVQQELRAEVGHFQRDIGMVSHAEAMA